MSILEALWFDNLVVQDAEIRKGSEQEKTLAASVRCEDALRETLMENKRSNSRSAANAGTKCSRCLKKRPFCIIKVYRCRSYGNGSFISGNLFFVFF